MTQLADTIEIEIPCPQCGKKLKEKLGRLHRDKHITCPQCGRIALTGNGLRDIKSALDQLERTLANLGR